MKKLITMFLLIIATVQISNTSFLDICGILNNQMATLRHLQSQRDLTKEESQELTATLKLLVAFRCMDERIRLQS